MFRALLAIFLLVPALAVAQQRPTDPVARRHFERGLAAYEAGKFDVASREFEVAYSHESVPALLISWGQAERFAGRCSHAIELFRKYLPSASSSAQVDFTNDLIRQCERQLELQQPLPRGTVADPPEPTPAPWWHDTVGGALAAAGVVGIGAGIGFFIAAGNSAERAEQAVHLDEYVAARSEQTTRRRIGAVSLTLGAVLIASGAYRYHTVRQRGARDIIAGTDGRSIFVGARF